MQYIYIYIYIYIFQKAARAKLHFSGITWYTDKYLLYNPWLSLGNIFSLTSNIDSKRNNFVSFHVFTSSVDLRPLLIMLQIVII